MVYESSYECGRTPFRPDITRGTWAAPRDFIFASIGLAFRLDIFAISMSMGYLSLAPEIIIPYLLCLCIYVVPIFVIQSFMGQFSSSGYISAFRLTPIFKGIGYISLALNISILTYYSLFAAVPLMFLFNSMRPTLPWSIEGVDQWQIGNGTEQIISYGKTHRLRAVIYFGSLFGEKGVDMRSLIVQQSFAISWQMLLCTLLTWLIVACLFWKFFNTQIMGTIIRYAMGVIMALLLLCLARFCFLPGPENRLIEYFFPESQFSLLSVALHTVSAFGGGWGSVIVLSSFNKFQTNIMRQSWLIVLGQTVVWLALGGIVFLLESYYSELPKDSFFDEPSHIWIMYFSAADAMATMELPNLWCILYYTMLTLAALVALLTQLYGILTSLFDEYESLRARKSTVICSLLGFLTLCSLYSCTSYGISYFGALAVDGLMTQTALNLLLLLVVLWIYGRERFQRDIEFMLGRPFATWKVYMLRFVSPLVLLFILIFAFIAGLLLTILSFSLGYFIAALLFIVIPWLFVPGYMIYILLQTTGSVMMRLRRCCRPNDWYPIDMEERQRYEDAMGNMDITHQLKVADAEVVVP